MSNKKLIGILVACIIGVFIVIGIATSGEGTPAPVTTPEVPTTPAETTEPTTPTPTPTWTKVISWEGSSIKDTETFSITANEWRIQWSTKPGEYGDMNFQIYVYEANGNLKTVAANIIGEGSDVSHVRGSGDYYLTINTGQPYTITIEQKQ